VRAAEASGKGKRGQSISAARCKNAKEVGHGAGDEKVAADEPADEEGAEGKEPKGQERVDTLPMPAAFNNSNYADRMSTGFLSPAHLARTAHAFYPHRGPLLFVKRLTKAGPLAGPVLFIPLFSSSSSSSFYFFFLFFFLLFFQTRDPIVGPVQRLRTLPQFTAIRRFLDSSQLCSAVPSVRTSVRRGAAPPAVLGESPRGLKGRERRQYRVHPGGRPLGFLTDFRLRRPTPDATGPTFGR
jgi:hypothetical protein